MVDHLKNLGFTPDEIVEAGLATRKNSSNSKSSRKVKKRQKKFEEPPHGKILIMLPIFIALRS